MSCVTMYSHCLELLALMFQSRIFSIYFILKDVKMPLFDEWHAGNFERLLGLLFMVVKYKIIMRINFHLLCSTCNLIPVKNSY